MRENGIWKTVVTPAIDMGNFVMNSIYTSKTYFGRFLEVPI